MAKLLNDEQYQFLLDHYKGIGNQEIADLMNRTFGLSFTREHMKNYKSNHKLDSGLRYIIGLEPANKGKHQAITGNMTKTMFKPGDRPHNVDSVGTETLRPDGYVWVKISDDKVPHRKNWKQKHRILWEKANGPIPNGYFILFADGNHMNFDLDNLVLVTKSEMLKLNQGSYIYPDPDMTKAMLKVVKIRNRLIEIERNDEND